MKALADPVRVCPVDPVKALVKAPADPVQVCPVAPVRAAQTAPPRSRAI